MSILLDSGHRSYSDKIYSNLGEFTLPSCATMTQHRYIAHLLS